MKTPPAGAVIGIDHPSVEAWLREHVAGANGPFTFERKIGGHSNLTYRVTDPGGTDIVLRRPPLGELLPTAHDMGREWKIIEGLWGTGVPVAEPIRYEPDPDVTGAHFYVMGHVEGHVMHDITVATDVYNPAQCRHAGESFIEVLGEMHNIDPDDIGLGDLGRKEGYIERQLNRWGKQYEASKTAERPELGRVRDFLSENVPEQGPARLVHGDYRLGNCLTTDEGTIVAVLDWEIATLGDPLADLGYVLATWSRPGDPMPNDQFPTYADGFPDQNEVIEIYGERTDADVSAIDFYVAFSFWKSACISEGVYRRYLDGALSTEGVDLDSFPISVDRATHLANEAADRYTAAL